MATNTLSSELLHKMDAYWRAANYLSVGQIYLYDNPLLKRPLTLADVKHMLLGHWGTTPGQNFIYVHLNRVIKKYDLDPNVVRVELYADGVNDSSPIRQEMTRVRQLAGADSGHAYVAQVPATRPLTDYTARIIPHCAGVAVPLEVDPILWQR